METRFVERLTRYKVPSVVEFRDQLPKSMIDKIVRRSLHSVADHGRISGKPDRAGADWESIQ
jgi:acyl-coenzyme A synthetase/AMP-(fatty) acid ligase